MEQKSLQGISGWLIIVAIGIVLRPLIWIRDMGLYADISEYWELIDLPLKLYLAAEILISIIIILSLFYLAFLFFSKKTQFPKIFINVNIGVLLFLFFDFLIFKILFPNDILFDSETIKTTFQNILYACVWIPYVIYSERVKQTFIN